METAKFIKALEIHKKLDQYVCFLNILDNPRSLHFINNGKASDNIPLELIKLFSDIVDKEIKQLSKEFESI